MCGTTTDKFSLAPGRSGPQLAASLMHLESFVSSCSEFSDAYSRATDPGLYKEDAELLSAEEFPQLVPYPNLNAERFRLVGKGHWQAVEFLDGPLWLSFVEPRFLLHGLPIRNASLPNFKYEDKSSATSWLVSGTLMDFWPFLILLSCLDTIAEFFNSSSLPRRIARLEMGGCRKPVNIMLLALPSTCPLVFF